MPEAGDIVQSKQGRDRYRVFLVTEIDEGNAVAPVVVADGRKHTLREQKHKNPRHLSVLRRYSQIDEKLDFGALSDVQVYEICEKYDICRKKYENPLDKLSPKNI